MFDVRIQVGQTLPKPEKRPSRKNGLALWCIAVWGMIAAVLAMSALYAAGLDVGPFTEELIIDLLYYLPFIALPAFLLAKRRPGLYEAYRPGPISALGVLMIVALAVLGVFFINDITLLWSIPFEALGLNTLTGGIPVATNTQELLMSVLTIAVIPAVCEELLFRGVILSSMEAHGTKRAMRLSALLFMLIHASVVGAPGELIVGVIMASVVFWYDSIYAGIIYHTVHNTVVVLLSYAQSSMAVATDAAETELSVLEAIGGLSGVVSLLLSVVIAGALIRSLLSMIRLRGQLRGIVVEERKKQPLGRGEKCILALGLLGCALLYGSDILSMLGV